MNFAIAQINPISGAFQSNTEKICQYIKKSEILNCKFLITPEKALCGYALKDTFKRFPYLFEFQKKYLEIIAQNTNNYAIIGYADENYNSKYALIFNKQIISTISNNTIIEIDGTKYSFILDNSDLSIIVKADICVYTKAICIGHKNKKELTDFLLNITQNYKKAVVHINPVGATDSLSFEGSSVVYNKSGSVISRCTSFEENLEIVDLSTKNSIHPEVKAEYKNSFDLNYENNLEYTYKIVLQGIRDYFQKCGLKRAVLGLSGGLDSSVCAVLLADALGKENVYGISMPSKLTSKESKSDAKILAENLGIHFSELSIKPMFETTNECLTQLFNDVEENWNGRFEQSFTPDNIQARSRAMYLWGIANEFASCIPIATSDKSEAYMGYATINGDMSGGFAPILDITKTKLFALAKWLNKNRKEKNAIPESVILKKPGAELAIDSKTGKPLNAEDALMPYEFMDEVIWRIENKHETYSDMIKSEFIYEKKCSISIEQKQEWLDKFFKRMSCALYKSSIMPPSIITNYPTNIKTAYYQPITSGQINYRLK